MPTIKRGGQFKKDYRRELKGRHQRTVEGDVAAVVALLLERRPLDQRFADHALHGAWKDHRDCHVRPDLILIYRWEGADELHLVRLGSHSELGL